MRPPSDDERRQLMNIWAEKHGLRRSTTHACLRHLVGQRCDGISGTDIDGCPTGDRNYADHPTLWLQNGSREILIFQPYGLSKADIEEILEDAERYDVSLRLDAWPSWHYPGSVLTVTFQRTEPL